MRVDPSEEAVTTCTWTRDPRGENYYYLMDCTGEFETILEAEDYEHCWRCGRPVSIREQDSSIASES